MTKVDIIRKWFRGDHPNNPEEAFSQFQKETEQKEIAFNYFAGVIKSLEKEHPKKIKQSKQEIKLKTVDDLTFDPSILKPYKSKNECFDVLASYENGIMPACITIVPGESGIGKTSVMLDILGNVKKQNPNLNILFISSEMNEIHMFKYAKRIDITGVKILFLQDYQNPMAVLEETLKKGWHIVLIDSFQDTVNKIKLINGIPTTKIETWLLKLMDETRKGRNEIGVYTHYFCTQHMTKGGDYTGSTNIKHMSDAMLMLLKDESNANETYMMYIKNRDGQVGKRVYFKFVKDAGIYYDSHRFQRDEVARETLLQEKKELENNDSKWEEMFGVKKEVVEN